MATQKQLQEALHKHYDRMVFITEVLKPVFGSRLKVATMPLESTELTVVEKKYIKMVNRYAEISLDDGRSIRCFEVLLQDNVRIELCKVAIQQYVRKHLFAGEAALVNFISPKDADYWRFTLVARDSKLGEEGIEKDDTHPKRYTYLVEPTGQNRTMAERLSNLSLKAELSMKLIRDAFSVEAMGKAFFDEYKEHYQNFVEYLTGKRMVKEKGKWAEKITSTASPFLMSVFNGDEKNARDFIKKLMGRIVFLYFVQKKGWLGASNADYTDGAHDFIFQLFKETGGNEKFFPFGLTELFFNALNQKRKGDDWTTPTGRRVKIPYLNGGLFNRDDVDDLIHGKKDMLTFPPEYFANHKDAESPEGRGFLDFLNAYNFTVYEDSQDDHIVAVDPEMLGHIFENLLEDNKDKGAFYTPKEIVHYMCQESLTEYLVTHMENQFPQLERTLIEKLVRNKETDNLDTKQLTFINEFLDKVKICDPAIGSGAFPMGLLHEIFSIKEVLAYAKGEVLDAARVKENIIQNSIYGVDIERGAVDIARLRFWLSLVVDEEKPRELPNLDYKIVVGNSLLSMFEDEVIEIEWDLKPNEIEDMFGDTEAKKRRDLLADISKTQKDYFQPEKAADKDKLKSKIRNLKIDLLINQLELMIKAPKNEKGKKVQKGKAGFDLVVEGWKKTIQNLKDLKKNTELPFDHFDWKLDFPEILNPVIAEKNFGFDIVIANPPYGVSLTDEARESIVNLHGKVPDFEIYYYFINLAKSLLKNKGIKSYIIPNTILFNVYAKKYREATLKNWGIKNILDCTNFNIFEDSATVRCIITVFSSEESDGVILYKPTANTETFLELAHKESSKTTRDILLENNTNWALVFKLDVETLNIVSKIKKDKKTIIDFFPAISQGLIAYDKYQGQDKETIKNRIYHSKKPKKGWKNWLWGEDVTPYLVEWNGVEQIDYCDGIANPRDPKFFVGERVLIREITNPKIFSGYTDAENYHDPAIIVVLANKEDYAPSIKYLLALLNSRLATFYHFNSSPKATKGAFPKILVEDIKNFPFQTADYETTEKIISLVDKIISLKKNDKSADTSKIEGIIDDLVFDIYGLSPDEVAKVKGVPIGVKHEEDSL